jgi:Patatin-like phospholipase
MANPKQPASAGSPLTLEEVLVEEFELLHGRSPPRGSLDAFYREIHGLVHKGEARSALCLSGGGIRSASFGLGVLQALSKRKVLFEFNYLSTVSGGGYIGGWLSAWRERVDDDLTVGLGLFTGVPNRHNEQPEISSLRANSNYLTPKLGAMSADTWTLAALYIRNLFLNWLIFLPAIVAVVLVPILARDFVRLASTWWAEIHYSTVAAACVLLFLALNRSVSARLDKTKDRRVTQGQFLRRILVPIYSAATLLSLSVATKTGGDLGPLLGPVIGAAIYALAWFWAGRSRHTEKDGERATDDRQSPGLPRWLAWIIAGAIAGGLIGLGYHLASSAGKTDSTFRLIVIFAGGWVAMSMFLAESLYLGLSSYSIHGKFGSINGDFDREWMARSSGWFVVSTLVWAALAALVLFAHEIVVALLGVSGIATAGAGAGIAGSWAGSSAKTLATSAGKRIESFSMTTIISIATVIFLAALAILLANVLVDGLKDLNSLVIWKFFGWTELKTLFITLVVLIACIGVAGFFAIHINVNRFSSHATYRNRLARAFLGAARGVERENSATRDRFTDFDSQDNARVFKLAKMGGAPRLFPVINMALNVVGGDNLAWQERKAEPFVVTPLASGNDNVKFCRTEHYASPTEGLTLATAMAISGAAASPNQGYHSSPLVGLLMTLFNVRLGWWLGNPRCPKAARSEGPPAGVLQIIQELFGLTTSDSNYIYLSDGGHFENLGIYEMVRRRCHFIVACDAGCDPNSAFEDLGNAVRKIWIDLGVQIDFNKIDIKKRDVTPPGLYCAMATIRYPEPGAEPGYLLYLKPGFHNDGSQPADVNAYGLANPAFPHESTADQFFSESQMESYRSLGSHIIDVVFGPTDSPLGPSGPTPAIRPFWQHIQDYITPKRPDLDARHSSAAVTIVE